MKLPKSKTGLFVVERHINGEIEGVPIAVWLTEESADNYAGACEQECLVTAVLVYLATVVSRVYRVIAEPL